MIVQMNIWPLNCAYTLAWINAQADIGCSRGAHPDQGPPDWPDCMLKEKSIILRKLFF